MHRAAGQGGVSGAGGDVVLVGQFAAQQGRLGIMEVGQYHRHGLVPPGQTSQIGLAAVVVGPGQVHARQHVTHGGAMHGLGLQLAPARQLVDHGRRFAAHGVQDVAIAVGGGVGHRNAAPCQVLHQEQIKRQLFLGQALEQGEHVIALGRGGEVIGVFDAALNAAQFCQFAQVQGLHQLGRLGLGDFGEYRHGRACEGTRGLAG